MCVLGYADRLIIQQFHDRGTPAACSHGFVNYHHQRQLLELVFMSKLS